MNPMPTPERTEGTHTPQYDAMLAAIEKLPRIEGDAVLRAFAKKMEQAYMESRFDDITRTGSGMIWDAVQKLSPWSESNDMPWEDEILCGLSLAKKDMDDLRAQNEALRGALESIARAPAFDANSQSLVDLAQRTLKRIQT